MYYVYLLKLVVGSYYSGITSTLKLRIKEHRRGKVIATSGKSPIKLVFFCAFPSKKQAIEFENYLKTGSGQAFRNKHLIRS